MPPRDIAVAGCGPAGLAAALLLARDGHRVTLFERFAEPEPVGSGLMLQPTGLAVLDRLGLSEPVLAAGARVARLTGIAAASGRTVLDVRYASLRQTAAFGLGIHRAALFGVLHAAVRAAGLRIEAGREVVATECERARHRLRFADGSVSSRHDLVVDALGSRSPLAPTVGRPLSYGALWATLHWPGEPFDPEALQQRYRGARQMAGVLPIGRMDADDARYAAFFWSLRADRLARWKSEGIAAWKAEATALWPALAPMLEAIVSPEQLTFARYAHRTLPRAAEPALIHIGDAWHSTSPQLGQGANMALLDAWALAKAMREEPDMPAALAAAVRMRRRHVTRYQAMSRLLTPVYQSDGRLVPLLRDRLIGPVSKLRAVNRMQAAMVSGLVGDPLRPLGLA